MSYVGNKPAQTTIPVDDSVTTIMLQDDAVTSAKIDDGTIATADIADDAVTVDKVANAINTSIAANTAKVTNATHTGDVTGATALTIATDAVDIAMLSATGSASASTFLRGDNSWASAGGSNTPAFHAYMTGLATAWSSGSWTLVPCALETFDTDADYDTTAYRFTPTTAGKYWFYGQVVSSSNNGTLSNTYASIYKNGTEVVTQRWHARSGALTADAHYSLVGILEDMNGSSDYVELWGYMSTDAGARVDLAGYDTRVFFGGFRLL